MASVIPVPWRLIRAMGLPCPLLFTRHKALPFVRHGLTADYNEARLQNLEGSFRLAYNASAFAREGLGYLLTFKYLVDVSAESGLVFRPLSPLLENKMYLIWRKQQLFTPHRGAVSGYADAEYCLRGSARRKKLEIAENGAAETAPFFSFH